MTSGGGKPGQGYPAMIAFSYIDDGRDATTELVPTLRVGTTLAHGKSAGGVGGNAAVAYAPKPLHYTHDYNQDRVYDPEGVAPAVCAQDSAGARQELTGTTVRRLTPRECERLQGFQDDWTLVPYRGRSAADGPRYRVIGNSMAVPVMRWIGERIALVEAHLAVRNDNGT